MICLYLNLKMKNKRRNQPKGSDKLTFENKVVLTGAKAILIANIATALIQIQIDEVRESYKKFKKSIAK